MDAVQKAVKIISGADGLLIGISNGLSIAEGYNIFADNEMFREQFGKFRDLYGIRCVLDGIFYKYPTHEERNNFFDTLIYYWIQKYEPGCVMKNLLKIVRGKDYFIITSNGDMHLELSGFSPDRIFEIEGTFINSAKNMPIEDKSRQLHEFIEKFNGKRLVFLEIGIGSRNRLIKAPMMELAASRPDTEYIIFNLHQEIYVPDYLSAKTIPLAGDLAVTLNNLAYGIQ